MEWLFAPCSSGPRHDLALPDGFLVNGSGLVVWHDKEGNSGLKFYCSEPEMRKRLDSWLHAEFRKDRMNSELNQLGALSAALSLEGY